MPLPLRWKRPPYISVEELQQASGVANSVFDKLRSVGALGSLPETSQVDLFSLM